MFGKQQLLLRSGYSQSFHLNKQAETTGCYGRAESLGRLVSFWFPQKQTNSLAWSLLPSACVLSWAAALGEGVSSERMNFLSLHIWPNKGASCPASSTVSNRQLLITPPGYCPTHAGTFCFQFSGEDSNYGTGTKHLRGSLPRRRDAQSQHSPQATISPLNVTLQG